MPPCRAPHVLVSYHTSYRTCALAYCMLMRAAVHHSRAHIATRPRAGRGWPGAAGGGWERLGGGRGAAGVRSSAKFSRELLRCLTGGLLEMRACRPGIGHTALGSGAAPARSHAPAHGALCPGHGRLRRPIIFLFWASLGYYLTAKQGDLFIAQGSTRFYPVLAGEVPPPPLSPG